MKILLYANVNLNLIDGSTIWVQSVAEILSGRLGFDVLVLSRDRLEDKGVVPALRRCAKVRIASYFDFPAIVAQHPKAGDVFGIEKIVKDLDKSEGIDRMIVRDRDAAMTLSRVVALRSRLWAYVLDSPSLEVSGDRSALGELVEAAGGLIVQTDVQRALLEAVFPTACGKTNVLPPMIDVPTLPVRQTSPGAPVSFIYSGKYSKTWNVEAFFDVPEACRAEGIPASVTMIGDKVHNEKEDAGFRARILAKLSGTPEVTWLGAMEREAAIAQSANHDLGLCWRTEALDDSTEISTKFLEFASVGVPSVVNRTAAYEVLLGESYPYFATTMADVVAAAAKVRADPERHDKIRQDCRVLAQAFTYETAAKTLANALLVTRRPEVRDTRPVAVLIASHDLKFLQPALDRLSGSGNKISYDMWQSTVTHDQDKSQALLRQADVIFCEWCAGQAIWYSHHKLPNQKLFIRLHRFEAFRNFPREVAADAVDGFIVVSDYFKQLCVSDFGWPAEKIAVLPQYCDASQLRRQKHPGFEHTLGFVGINGYHHKRFDRAIDILRLVRRDEPDFRMRVRSAMPWEFDWIWKDNSDERAKFQRLFESIERDTELRDAIIFDRPGANMPEWYRNIGYILSTSESEGCHTSVAEGICSGAIPVVIDWPGAQSVYGAANVHSSVEDMASAILNDHRAGRASSIELMSDGARNFDIGRTVDHLQGWFHAAPTVNGSRQSLVDA